MNIFNINFVQNWLQYVMNHYNVKNWLLLVYLLIQESGGRQLSVSRALCTGLQEALLRSSFFGLETIVNPTSPTPASNSTVFLPMRVRYLLSIRLVTCGRLPDCNNMRVLLNINNSIYTLSIVSLDNIVQ